MTAFQRSSRREDRKQSILDTMRRLHRPIYLGDLSPRASEHAVYEMALKDLLAEGKIVSDTIDAFRRKYYRLADT